MTVSLYAALVPLAMLICSDAADDDTGKPVSGYDRTAHPSGCTVNDPICVPVAVMLSVCDSLTSAMPLIVANDATPPNASVSPLDRS